MKGKLLKSILFAFILVTLITLSNDSAIAESLDLTSMVMEVEVTPTDITGNVGTLLSSSFTVSTCTPVVTVSPKTASVEIGGTQQFFATTVCDGVEVEGCYTWEIMERGITGSTIDANGLYTAGISCGSDIIKATDTCNGYISNTASVTITGCCGLPTVKISPDFPDSLLPGETIQFNASTICSNDGSSLSGNYQWSVTSTIGSSIDASTGLYTAGSIWGTDTITVTDTANGYITDSVMVVVGGTMAVSPNPIHRSLWIFLPQLMILQSDTANFNILTTRVAYSPAIALIPTPRLVLGPHSIWQLVFVNPPWLAGGVTDGTLRVTVITGSEVVSATTNIEMLPFGLDK